MCPIVLRLERCIEQFLLGWPTVWWVQPASEDKPSGNDSGATSASPSSTQPLHGATADVPVLLDVTDDRWAWRRRIRQNPTQAFVYRIGVGLLGALFIIAGLATGPLPGPGGIPLILLGLATWASEFEWAQRLMQYFLSQVRRYRSWSLRTQVLFWVILIVSCWLAGYVGLVLFDIPPWVPATIAGWLDMLPGVHAR